LFNVDDKEKNHRRKQPTLSYLKKNQINFKYFDIYEDDEKYILIYFYFILKL